MFINILIISPSKEVKAEVNVNKPQKPLYVSARTAIAMDAESKIVLYEKNSHDIVAMASTTKIITALVALKYGELDKKVEISSKAASIHGSTVGYKKGEMISIKELLYGLMFRSGNDAAIAIAEGIGGSVEEFLNLMNEYGKEIGLIDSSFQSPHGLDSEKHYSTAYDLAIATAKAKEIKFFNDIVSDKDIDAKEMGFTRSYHNINKLLWQIPEANGVKTGYTGNAGKCLVSSVQYNGRDIIIVVLNCVERWKETKRIYDYVVENYEYKNIIDGNKIINEQDIKDGDRKVELVSNKDIILPIKKGKDFRYDVIVSKDLKAPISKDQMVGMINVYELDKQIFTAPIYSKEEVNKAFVPRSWKNIFKKNKD